MAGISFLLLSRYLRRLFLFRIRKEAIHMIMTWRYHLLELLEFRSVKSGLYWSR